MNLANQIIMYRGEHGLSQEEFGKLCKMTGMTISNIERGKHKPSKMVEARIKMVLGIAKEDDLVERIVQYRAKRNLNQAEFAELCGIAPQTIYSIEKREQKPQARTLYKLMKVLEGGAK